MAKIIKISELPKAKELSPKMKSIKEKLLNAPAITNDEIKEYEKADKWMRGWKI